MEFFTRKKMKFAGKMAVRQAVDKIIFDSKHMIVPMYNHMHRWYSNRQVKQETVEILDVVMGAINKLALKTIDAIEVSPTKNMRVSDDNFVIIYHPYPTICSAHVTIEFCGHVSYGNQRYSDFYEQEKET